MYVKQDWVGVCVGGEGGGGRGVVYGLCKPIGCKLRTNQGICLQNLHSVHVRNGLQNQHVFNMQVGIRVSEGYINPAE